jgi:hypothetical protein
MCAAIFRLVRLIILGDPHVRFFSLTPARIPGPLSLVSAPFQGLIRIKHRQIVRFSDICQVKLSEFLTNLHDCHKLTRPAWAKEGVDWSGRRRSPRAIKCNSTCWLEPLCRRTHFRLSDPFAIGPSRTGIFGRSRSTVDSFNRLTLARFVV